MKTSFLHTGLATLGTFSICYRSAAQSTIIGYNPSAGLDYLQTVSSTDASSFTVGVQDMDVTSVQFFLSSFDAWPFDTTAYIFADSNGKPGNIVGSSSQTYTPVAQNISPITYTFANPLTLSAGDLYWVGCGTSTDGQLYVGSISSINGFVENGVTPSFNLCIGDSPPDPQTWGGVSEGTATLAYQLEGYAVPEPALMTLSVTGAAILWFSRRIKRGGAIL